MGTATERSLGPGVRLVVGEDALLSVGATDEAQDGIEHLRPQRAGREIMVLHHRGPDTEPLVALADRLIWLDGRVGAPRLIASGRSEQGAESVVIKMSSLAVSGASPLQPIEPEALARQMGTCLRMIHSLPIGDCLFDSSPEFWRTVAASRVVSGTVIMGTDGPYAREDPDDLLEVLDELLEATATDRAHPVLIHGRANLANTWLIPDGSVCFTGWQHAGIGDRHHDLAVAAASLSLNFGSPLVPALLDAYGIDGIDLRILDLHQILVHLTGAAT